MKILSVLALMVLMTANGATDARAEDKLAKLADPLTADSTRTVAPREIASAPTGLLAATGLSELEVEGIRIAIRGQIRALAARDADTAFTHLTPLVQDYYADPEAFVRGIALSAWPVLAVQDFIFIDIEREATDAIQHVVLTDKGGRKWDAAFKLERQPDGRWAIKNCLVEPTKGPSV
ncbi:MAG: DUF4864 domain-containing protein [Pseudomonadota bacterium]|nr:DUF4864 domain-containing protein [Pseudomonadota bacterium]